MREKGLNQTDSLMLLMRVTGMDKSEASNVILESRTWADHKENNLRLQETLAQALLEFSVENEDPNFKIIVESDDSGEPED
jgi:hypothetical protein